MKAQEQFKTTLVDINILQEHPQNYKQHPEDQLYHIIESIKEHGIYRNIIVSKDNYILAGHGVVRACKKMDKKEIPVIYIDIPHTDSKALKILVGDNEIANLGIRDNKSLAEILQQIKSDGLNGLLGTGYDNNMLLALAMVSRPTSEIADINETKEWIGMPDYESGDNVIKATVIFNSIEERTKFINRLEIKNARGVDKKTCSFWYPDRENSDPSSLIIEDGDEYD